MNSFASDYYAQCEDIETSIRKLETMLAQANLGSENADKVNKKLI